MKNYQTVKEFLSTIVDKAEQKYKECPEKCEEWDNFYQITLNRDDALEVLFAQDGTSNSGFLIDEGPSERRYNIFDEEGDLTSWGKSLFDQHKNSGYRRGISNQVHVGINVEELKNVSESGEIIKFYQRMTLALLNYHRRRSFYYQEEFAKYRPNEEINFHFYLWKPCNDGKVRQYQSLYDLFDSSTSVDNAKSKIQGILNLAGIIKDLKTEYFIGGNFTSALKHVWGAWSSEKYDNSSAIADFREEIVWIDNLSLTNTFPKKKLNPHSACYFEAYVLATKKYGKGNQHLKRVFKFIDKTFSEINDNPLIYWCKVLQITTFDLMQQNRKNVLVDKRNFQTWVLSGAQWLGLESRGLHMFEKQLSFSNNSLSELIDLTNQQGRSYQRSAITNQQERYVSLILGYISKMMEASDVTSEMVQIKSNDREYLGDISYSDDKKTEDQKYSIMKNIIDEIKS